MTSVDLRLEQNGLRSFLANSFGVLPVFVLTIFLSAFLLFSVQPLFAKMVLPVLGGSPGVWSVAMVFFQAMLLAGYGYAHLLIKKFTLRIAGLIHLFVLLSAFVFLPLALPAGWDTPPDTYQSFWLLGLLTVSIGLPFFAVAANSPLLQAWFARTGHDHSADPYFLYGASNIGSFASLILFIVLFEPTMTLPSQTWAWALGFGILTFAIAICLIMTLSKASVAEVDENAETASPRGGDARTWKSRLQWMALAFVPSGLLVAVTAHISTDIAAAPFLWVIPLALFLLTFVLAFARKPIFSTQTLSLMVLVAAIGPFMMVLKDWDMSPWISLPVHLGFFFIATLLAHSYLVQLRPVADDLTDFYLWMSFGGVLGGAATTLVSPLVFNIVLEYPLLVLASLLCRPSIYEGRNTKSFVPFQVWVTLLAMMFFSIVTLSQAQNSALSIERSFFGVVRVVDHDESDFRVMIHGSTHHGVMSVTEDQSKRPTPLAYYHASGGIAQSLFAAQARLDGRSANMGVLGLGAGSILCHRKPGETWTSYEIDTAVVNAATDPSIFRFVPQCGQGDPIVVGDGRLTMQREPDGKFDYLLIDAFSSDSIPVHLMTVQAFKLYRAKIAADGLLAIHISNRYMELESVLASIAKELGMVGVAGRFAPIGAYKETGVGGTHVVVLANATEDLSVLRQNPNWKPLKATGTSAWTDDYSNIPAAIWRKYRSGRL